MNLNYNPNSIKEVLTFVADALKEKGYDPISQLTGYLFTDDLSYITNYQSARSVLEKFETDEYMLELVQNKLKMGADDSTRKVLKIAYDANLKKGMDEDQAVANIVGFLVSGEPTYIAKNDGARSMIVRYERDEIIEVLLRDYLQKY